MHRSEAERLKDDELQAVRAAQAEVESHLRATVAAAETRLASTQVLVTPGSTVPPALLFCPSWPLRKLACYPPVILGYATSACTAVLGWSAFLPLCAV